jgi:hypothetical protein
MICWGESTLSKERVLYLKVEALKEFVGYSQYCFHILEKTMNHGEKISSVIEPTATEDTCFDCELSTEDLERVVGGVKYKFSQGSKELIEILEYLRQFAK